MLRITAPVVVLLLAAAAVSADKDVKLERTEDLIQGALKAYKDGKLSDAISLLHAASDRIQAAQRDVMAALFPVAPAGWDAGEFEKTVGDEVARTYTRSADKQTVRIQMFSSHDMAKLQMDSLEFLKSPDTMKAMQLGKQSLKITDEGGWTVWTLTMGRTSAYRTAVCGSITVCLSAQKGDATMLDVFWKVLDLKALAGKSGLVQKRAI